MLSSTNLAQVDLASESWADSEGELDSDVEQIPDAELDKLRKEVYAQIKAVRAWKTVTYNNETSGKDEAAETNKQAWIFDNPFLMQLLPLYLDKNSKLSKITIANRWLTKKIVELVCKP